MFEVGISDHNQRQWTIWHHIKYQIFHCSIHPWCDTALGSAECLDKYSSGLSPVPGVPSGPQLVQGVCSLPKAIPKTTLTTKSWWNRCFSLDPRHSEGEQLLLDATELPAPWAGFLLWGRDLTVPRSVREAGKNLEKACGEIYLWGWWRPWNSSLRGCLQTKAWGTPSWRSSLVSVEELYLGRMSLRPKVSKKSEWFGRRMSRSEGHHNFLTI